MNNIFLDINKSIYGLELQAPLNQLQKLATADGDQDSLKQISAARDMISKLFTPNTLKELSDAAARSDYVKNNRQTLDQIRNQQASIETMIEFLDVLMKSQDETAIQFVKQCFAICKNQDTNHVLLPKTFEEFQTQFDELMATIESENNEFALQHKTTATEIK